jgi:ParB-like chromosome segregation protein Spo0J
MSPVINPTQEQRKLVPIDMVLQWDQSIQIRGGIDDEKVEAYRQIIKDSGGYMDPCRVYVEILGSDGPFWIADGFHRIKAYQAEGATKIPFVIKVGNKSKALKFALGENGHHGAQLTNAQKRHAAGMAVLDPEIGNLADAEIAKLIGCSPSLIATCRKGESLEEAAKKRIAKHQSKNGTVKGEDGEGPIWPEMDHSTVGQGESESTAPASSQARQRKPKETRPTKAMLLKQIESWIDDDLVDEQDVIDLFEVANAQYKFVAKPGAECTLRVVGRNGRAQLETKVIVKDLKFEIITLKYEGDGKIQEVLKTKEGEE